MRHTVRLTDDGDEDWALLSAPVRRVLRARLRLIAQDPFGRWALSLCGAPDVFRVRVDGLRILYYMEPNPRGPNLVYVFRIRRRETAYVGYEFDQH